MTVGVDGPKIHLTRVDHVPCHYDFMVPHRRDNARLRARGVREALPPGRGVWGAARPPTSWYGPNYATYNLVVSTVTYTGTEL